MELWLVCEETFQKWNRDGRAWQPISFGGRVDNPAEQIHRELPAAPATGD